MTGQDFAQLALQLAIMLACGVLGGACMRRLHQPAVLGEMLGGIVLGPTVFGWLWPAGYAETFVDGDRLAVVRGVVVQLGMLFFLLGVGLEIDLKELRRSGLAALAIGVTGSLVPLAAGMGIVYLLPGLWAIPPKVSRESYALFIGVCMANTANPVLARILTDVGLFKERLGGLVMAAAIVDDIIGWSLLAIVMTGFQPTAASVATAVTSQIAVVIVFITITLLITRCIVSPLLRVARQFLPWPTGYLSLIVIAMLLAAASAECSGIHAFFGPLMLGIAISPSVPEQREAHAVLEQFALSFFVPIYFVSMGLVTNFATHFQTPIVIAILATASLSKIVACSGAARLSGLDRRTSLAVGCGMNARGAMGVLLAGIGLENGIIDQSVYVALVVLSLVTSLAAGPLMQWLLPLGRTVPQGNG
jgi:Kef-type K+ transport system membrane component KefB